MKKTTKKTTKKLYSVILEVNGQEYKTEGDTLLEAIQALEVDEIRTGGLLTATKGKLTAQRRFNRIFQLKRLFFNKVAKVVIAKNLEMMMR